MEISQFGIFSGGVIMTETKEEIFGSGSIFHRTQLNRLIENPPGLQDAVKEMDSDFAFLEKAGNNDLVILENVVKANSRCIDYVENDAGRNSLLNGTYRNEFDKKQDAIEALTVASNYCATEGLTHEHQEEMRHIYRTTISAIEENLSNLKERVLNDTLEKIKYSMDDWNSAIAHLQSGYLGGQILFILILVIDLVVCFSIPMSSIAIGGWIVAGVALLGFLICTCLKRKENPYELLKDTERECKDYVRNSALSEKLSAIELSCADRLSSAKKSSNDLLDQWEKATATLQESQNLQPILRFYNAVPEEFRNAHALLDLTQLLQNGRADNLKEAYNLLEMQYREERRDAETQEREERRDAKLQEFFDRQNKMAQATALASVLQAQVALQTAQEAYLQRNAAEDTERYTRKNWLAAERSADENAKAAKAAKKTAEEAKRTADTVRAIKEKLS